MKFVYNTKKEWLPDYDKWIRRPYWQFVTDMGIRPFIGTTQEEASPLLFNLEPMKQKDFMRFIPATSDEGKTFLEIQTLLARAVVARSFELDAGVYQIPNHSGDFIINRIKPKVLLKWAHDDIGLEIAEPFLYMLEPKEEADKQINSCPVNASKIDFSCDNVTTWDQVELKIVNDYMVEIKARGQTYNKEYGEIGLSGRGKGPSKKWALLNTLANGNGMLRTDTLSPDERYDLKKRISQLRNYLKKIFPNIKEDPFEPWSTVNGYRTRFKIFSKTER